MSFRRRHRILAAGKSPSVEAMKRTYNRAILNGGVTQDFSANVENIRELSRKLGTNILQTITTRNILQYSQDFDNPIWAAVSTITANSTTSPNGDLTADKITGTTTNSYVWQNVPITTNTIYTYSVWLRSDAPLTTQINISDAGGTVLLTSALVCNLTTTWTRFQITFNSTTNTIAKVFGIGGASSFGVGSTAYMWGAQLEKNSGATTYQPTNLVQTNLELTSANFLYVPSSYGESRNFVQNPSIRNRVRNSEDLNSLWATDGTVNIVSNTTLNPFGVNKSYYLTEGNITSDTYIYQSVASTAGNYYTHSYYVKKAQDTWVQISAVPSFSSDTWVNFNFDTGVFGNHGTTGSWTAKQLINGYWLLSITDTALNSNSKPVCVIAGTNNTNVNSRAVAYTGTAGHQIVDITALQFEQGPVATPYQRTTDGIADFTFTRATSSTVTNKLGVIEDSCYNLLSNSTTGTTQTITVAAGTYNLSFSGTGSYTLSGVGSGTLNGTGATNRVNQSFTCTSGSLTLTVSGSITNVQFNLGGLRDYLKTTNRLNVPKLDYSRSLLKPSLLIEPQRTNLFTQSEDFTSSNWTKISSTVNLNTVLSPSNTLTADSIIPFTNNVSHGVYESYFVSGTNTYTFSCHVKNAGYNFAAIGVANDGNGLLCSFITDLTTGIISNVQDSFSVIKQTKVITLQNGWFRIIITASVNSSSSVQGLIAVSNTNTGVIYSNGIPVFLGDGTSGLYLWGGQLEVGSNATSYIPTTTATVTRNGDKAYVDLWNNNVLNQNNFTLFVEGFLYAYAPSEWLFNLCGDITEGNDTVGFYDQMLAGGYSSGAGFFPSITGLPNNSLYKVIIQRNGSSIKFFRNGVQIGTTQTVNPFNYRYLNVFAKPVGGTNSIDKIALFNRTLSDSDCILLTT